MIKYIVIFLVSMLLFANNIYSQWERIDNNINACLINSITEFDGKIYAATSNGLLLSTDQGKSWSTTNINYSINIVKAFDGELFVANNKLMRSVDSGKTWTQIDENRVQITSLIKSNNFIYYTSADIMGYFSRNYSFNNGEYWKTDVYYTYTDAKYIEEKNNVFYSNTNGWFTINTFNNTFNYIDNILPLGSNGVEMDNDYYWIATDKGIYKINLSNKISKFVGLYNLKVNFIKIINNKIFAITKEKGVYCSTDWGKTWLEKNNGLKELNVIDYLFTSNNSHIIATSNCGVFISYDDCENWVSYYDKKYNSIAFLNDNLFTLRNKFGIQKYDEINQNWVNLSFDFSNPIEIRNMKKVYFVRTDSIIYYNPNKDQNWKNLYKSETIKDIVTGKNKLFIANSHSINIFDFQNDFTYSIDTSYFEFSSKEEKIKQIEIFNNQIIIMTDSTLYITDEKIKKIDNIGLIGSEKIVGSKVSVNDRNEIVVTVSNGIFVSKDVGIHWEFYTISKDYNNYYYTYNLNVDYLFVNNKFYQSFDNRKTWNQLKTINFYGLDVFSIQAVCFSQNYMYCIDKRNEIYRNSLDYLTNIENETIEEKFKIFPNPCNEILSIDLENEQTNLIEIYDLQANLVFQQSLNQFESKIDLDISTLPKSVYFLKINNKIKSIIKE